MSKSESESGSELFARRLHTTLSYVAVQLSLIEFTQKMYLLSSIKGGNNS